MARGGSTLRGALILGALSVTLSAASAEPYGRAPSVRDDSLIALARVLGASHYLRGLCRRSEGEVWKSRMSRLMRMETPTGPTRKAMTDAFNAAYFAAQSRHRTCTDAAMAEARLYAGEGYRIAQAMTPKPRPPAPKDEEPFEPGG